MIEQRSSATKTLTRLRSARPTILPSLLLCDFANLEREVRALEDAGVDCLHLDVMDGHFVPNLTYGMPIVESLRRITELVLDVHLMISQPEKYASQFVEAGADCVTFHIEAFKEPSVLLSELRKQGILAGLAINPSTPLEVLLPHVQDCDLVLVMSVEAGFGGQAFNPIALERLKKLRTEFGNALLLEVDGGINEKTYGNCVAQGADMLVAGSAIFRHSNYVEAISRMRQTFP